MYEKIIHGGCFFINVVHHIPGRVRFRCARGFGLGTATMLADGLNAFGGVEGVRVNPRTGSVLLLYKGEAFLKSIADFLCHAGEEKERYAPAPAACEEGRPSLFPFFRYLCIRPLMPLAVNMVTAVSRALPFLRRGLCSLRKGRLDVDVLDGTAIAISLLRRDFSTVGLLTLLLGFGDALERFTQKKSLENLASHLALQADKVWVEREEREELVPFAELRESDVVIVRAGTAIPVDGVVVKGTALVNESSMTGEPMGVMRSSGSSVYAGTVVFDKTGTLTQSRPQVACIVPADGYDEDSVLRLSACLEEHFPHPVARAVVHEAERRVLLHEEEHTEVEYVVAHGIASLWQGKRVLLGSRHYISHDEGVDVASMNAQIDKLASEGYSLLYLAVDGKLAGIIAMEDPLREESAQVVEKLRALGVQHVLMLTGDDTRTASAVAKKLGIREFRAQVLPEDKARVVREWKEKGHTVLMVGDGINDSPALSASDVGVTLREGADLAREVADVVIMGVSLNAMRPVLKQGE